VVHERDLTGRAAKTDAAELQPIRKSLGEADGSGRLLLRCFGFHVDFPGDRRVLSSVKTQISRFMVLYLLDYRGSPPFDGGEWLG
jgi:hypothetical protein